MNSCMYVDKTSYFEEVLVIRVLESALVDETTGQHEEMSEQREQSENEVEDLGLDSEDGNLNHVFLFARDDGALVEATSETPAMKLETSNPGYVSSGTGADSAFASGSSLGACSGCGSGCGSGFG